MVRDIVQTVAQAAAQLVVQLTEVVQLVQLVQIGVVVELMVVQVLVNADDAGRVRGVQRVMRVQ